MEIIAISETPNHNTMKVSLSEPRQDKLIYKHILPLKKVNLNLLIDYLK